MTTTDIKIDTLADVLAAIEQAKLSPERQRDLISAVKRIAEMAARSLATTPAEAETLRAMLIAIRPAAHGVKPKTWSNLVSAFRAALELAGVIDPMNRGGAVKHPVWGPLLRSIRYDRRLADGIAAFANYCAANGIPPDQVCDDTVRRFQGWLENRTIYLRDRNLVRGVPLVWNDAVRTSSIWPKTNADQNLVSARRRNGSAGRI